MANVKITDLLAYTDAASTDVLPIVDVSNNVTKKISISDLLKATPLGSAAAPAIAIDGDPNTGIYSPGADTLAFVEGGTEAMRIDSSGNVGIGTTIAGARLQVNAPGTSRVYTSSVLDFSNIHLDGVTPSTTTSALTFSSGSGGGAAVAFSRDNAFGTYIGFWTNSAASANAATERLRIDSSGRLLVGTSTARTNFYNTTATAQIQVEGVGAESASFAAINVAGNASGARLYMAKGRGGAIGSNTIVASGDVLGQITFQGNDGSEFVEGATIEAQVDGTPGANDMPGRLVFSTTADGASSPTERMRITSSGSLLLGNTAVFNAGERLLVVGNGTNTSATFYQGTTSSIVQLYLGNPNGNVGSILTSGTTTSFNTSSDYRLKENVVPLTGAINRISQLQAHRFNFITDPDNTVDGFIAHEAQAVVPECVTGAKDELDDDGNPVYQGIDQSKLVPLLTAALQEAIAKIETLEAKVAALEAA